MPSSLLDIPSPSSPNKHLTSCSFLAMESLENSLLFSVQTFTHFSPFPTLIYVAQASFPSPSYSQKSSLPSSATMSPMRRRPSSCVESFSSSHRQDDSGEWLTTSFVKGMWVTLRPSTKGVHKVPRRYLGSALHHWKARIKDLKVATDGSKMVKVQHVYKASQTEH